MQYKRKIQALITELKSENRDRSIAMNDENCSQYSYSALAHTYNNTLSFIEKLEKILG